MNLRLLGKNVSVYVVGSIILRLNALLLIPLYTFTVSLRDYGVLVTLMTTVQVMTILMNMGMGNTFLRFAKRYEDQGRMGILLTNSLLIILFGGISVTGVTLVALTPFFQRVLHMEDVRSYVMLTCLAALSQTLCYHTITYYRAKNQAANYMFGNVATALLLIVANIVFLLVFRLGVKGSLMAHIFAYTVILSYQFVHVVLKDAVAISPGVLRQLIAFGFPLIFSMFSQFIINASSTYFLSFYAGLEAVGMFSLGVKLAQILDIMIGIPFQLACPPFIYANLDEPGIRQTTSKLFTLLIDGLVLMAVAILIGAKVMMPFLAPPAYSAAYAVIVLMIPISFFRGILYFGETLLNIVHKTYWTGMISSASALISLALNFYLIPRYGLYGAIIATNMSFLSVGLVTFYRGFVEYPLTIQWTRLAVTASFLVCFLTLVFRLQGYNNVAFLASSCVAAAVGCLWMCSVYMPWRFRLSQ